MEMSSLQGARGTSVWEGREEMEGGGDQAMWRDRKSTRPGRGLGGWSSKKGESEFAPRWHTLPRKRHPPPSPSPAHSPKEDDGKEEA